MTQNDICKCNDIIGSCCDVTRMLIESFTRVYTYMYTVVTSWLVCLKYCMSHVLIALVMVVKLWLMVDIMSLNEIF